MPGIKGTRCYPDANGHLWLPPASYGKDADGIWNARAPRGGSGILDGHTVVEHDDGTITISPSLDLPGIWHGFLRAGVFEKC